jgi:hypothetical protein
MSEFLQFGHPDADQIGAFVERALPAHERERMLGHLAVCPECRTVVALTLPPAEAPAPPPASERKPWFAGWALAWPAAAAFATLAVIVVYFHQVAIAPNSPAPSQIARVNPPASIASPAEAPAASAKPRTLSPAIPNGASREVLAPEESKQNPETAIPAPTIESIPVNGRNTGSLNELAQAPVLPAEELKKSVKANPPPRVRVSGDFGVASGVAGANFGNTAKSQPQETFAARSPGKIIFVAPQETNANAIKPPVPNSQTVVEMRASSAQTESANAAASLETTPVAQFKHRLPSRLPVLSMARQAQLIVAIDTSNAVFLSKDDGKHWKAVHAPWPGRPVRAQLAGYTANTPVAKTFDNQMNKKAQPVGEAASPEIVRRAAAAPRPSFAALPGSILTGIVTDQTGAVISGATVRTSNPETAESHSVQSDRNGLYRINGLAPGTYTLKVDARGFERYAQSSVPITVSTPTVVNVRLTLGAETQTVSVVADALAVQTDSNVVSTLIEEEDQPLAVFEIITDSGERWTSTDGATWKRP